MEYQKSLKIQYMLVDYIKKCEDIAGFFLLVEHFPVFTVGKNGGMENLLWSKEYIASMGIDLYETDRGGNITYHGPGQIVGYPILNLKHFHQDIHWYLQQLEETIIITLKDMGMLAGRKNKYRGVWVGENKICAMGISVKNWITYHGFALNYSVNEEHFRMIQPCGITELGVASIKKIKEDVQKEEVYLGIKNSFQESFNCELVEEKIEALEELILTDD